MLWFFRWSAHWRTFSSVNDRLLASRSSCLHWNICLSKESCPKHIRSWTMNPTHSVNIINSIVRASGCVFHAPTEHASPNHLSQTPFTCSTNWPEGNIIHSFLMHKNMHIPEYTCMTERLNHYWTLAGHLNLNLSCICKC